MLVIREMTSKIYKIHSTKGEKVYIGSTKKKYLCARKADHLSTYRLNKGRHCASYDLFDEYGVENCSFVLLEECPLEQRFIRERWWIENTPHIVNENRPFITEEEHAKLKADSHQRVKAEQTEEKKKEKSEYQREWSKANREIPTQCECGGITTLAHMNRHRSTETHKKLMENPFLSAFDSLIILPKVERVPFDKKAYMAKYQEAFKGTDKYKAKNDRLKEKVPCDQCDQVMMRANLSRHKKTHHPVE
jgi:hypothetical protein